MMGSCSTQAPVNLLQGCAGGSTLKALKISTYRLVPLIWGLQEAEQASAESVQREQQQSLGKHDHRHALRQRTFHTRTMVCRLLTQK
jgi:hypothetical protein